MQTLSRSDLEVFSITGFIPNGRGRHDRLRSRGMDDWHEHVGTRPPSHLPDDFRVDVLFEDDLTFKTMPAGHIDWTARAGAIVLWRSHAPTDR